MTFIVSCILYSFAGSLVGFLIHIFAGIIEAEIVFDKKYFLKTVLNFLKVLLIMTFVSIFVALLGLSLLHYVIDFIRGDILFSYQLIYYILAFAAYDFGLKN